LGYPFSAASRFVARNAVGRVDQPFPLPADPLILRVVRKKCLRELHRGLPDDRADRGFVRRALPEKTGKILSIGSRLPAFPGPKNSMYRSNASITV
jgi:hypothetical protein